MLALSTWLWLATPPAIGPKEPPVTITEEDRAYHRQRTTLGIAGMSTLTGWAAVNIAGGLAGGFTSEGRLRHFHQGNAAWNSVNLVLGVVGLVDQLRTRRRVVDLASGLRAARRTQLGFLINGAIDIVYISAGAAMWQLARGRSERLEGYGQALVLQGVFLFGFDFAMAWAHERSFSRVSAGRVLGPGRRPSRVSSPRHRSP